MWGVILIYICLLLCFDMSNVESFKPYCRSVQYGLKIWRLDRAVTVFDCRFNQLIINLTITPFMRYNYIASSFWCNDHVVITSCIIWQIAQCIAQISHNACCTISATKWCIKEYGHLETGRYFLIPGPEIKDSEWPSYGTILYNEFQNHTFNSSPP